MNHPTPRPEPSEPPAEIIYPEGTRQPWHTPPRRSAPVTVLGALGEMHPATAITLILTTTALTVAGVVAIVALVTALAAAIVGALAALAIGAVALAVVVLSVKR